MKIIAIALALLPLMAEAAVYKCQDSSGRVQFSDRPCGGVAPDQQEVGEVVKLPPAPPPAASVREAAEQEQRWQEAHRYHLSEIPALRIQATQLIASGEPAKVALGKEMLYKIEQSEEAYRALRKARESRKEIEKRYSDAIRQFNR